MTPQAEEFKPDEEETSAAGDPQTAKETVTETNTPLPTAPIRCSTSHDPRSVQLDREQMTTPIRATVTAEGTTGINLESGKIELEGLIEKKIKEVKFAHQTDLRRSNRIKSARPNRKTRGIRIFFIIVSRLGNIPSPLKRFLKTPFPRLKKDNLEKTALNADTPSGRKTGFPNPRRGECDKDANMCPFKFKVPGS